LILFLLLKPNAIRSLGLAFLAGQNLYFEALHLRKNPLVAKRGSEPFEVTKILASPAAEIAISASRKPAWLSQKQVY
jgi:hypothetical protein